jgi:drug/metabolite transporter (DMT)-like permease
LLDRKEHLDSLAVGALLILCASWGLQQVAIKLIAADISPVMQSALRSIGATIIVCVWIRYRGDRIFIRDGTLWWGIAAGLLFGIEFLLIYLGLAYTNASRAVIFLYMSPFVVAIGSQVFVPGERLNRYQFAGLGIAFTGILVVFGESLSLPTREMLFGDTLMIVAAVFWGATTVVIKAGPLATIAPARTLLYQLAVSIPILLFGSMALREPGIVTLSTLAIGSLVYQTLWVASMTFLAWFWLIRHYPAPKIASFTFLTPLFGVIAGWAVLDEPITPALLIALALVGSGVYLVNRQS